MGTDKERDKLAKKYFENVKVLYVWMEQINKGNRSNRLLEKTKRLYQDTRLIWLKFKDIYGIEL